MAAKRRRTTKRHKLQEATTMDDEDLILEIVARLPLNYAVRCSILNKSIRRRISHQPNLLPHCSTFFRCSYNDPKIFTTISQTIRSTPLPTRSVTLDTNVFIKASCNGLLLLRVNRVNSLYYVFNPATAGIIVVHHSIEFLNDIGLAAPDNSRFKLVGVNSGTRLRFTVMVVCPTTIQLVIKSKVYLECHRILKLMRDEYCRSVYAHGSLYWLGDGCRITVVFDVEKESARLIDGPIDINGINISKWFGFADGAVHFVYSLASKIVICRYDHVEGEWGVKHMISKARNDDDEPLFFDGRWLFVFRKNGEGGDIYRYDLVTHLWEKMESLDCKPNLFSYTSTFAKVSDYFHLTEKDTYGFWANEGPRNALVGLQKLLIPAGTPIRLPPQDDLIKARPPQTKAQDKEKARPKTMEADTQKT